MNISVTTKYYKGKKLDDRTFGFLTVLDTAAIEGYKFIVDKDVLTGLEGSAGAPLVFRGYTTYKDKEFKQYLTSIHTPEGECLYEYVKK